MLDNEQHNGLDAQRMIILTAFQQLGMKARIIKEWAKTHTPNNKSLSERELICLELITVAGPISQRTLREIFNLSPAATSHLVRDMEKNNLITRPKKGKGYLLELTDYGKEAMKAFYEIQSKHMFFYLEGTSPENFAELLKRIQEIDISITGFVNNQIFHKKVAPVIQPDPTKLIVC
jgi:DNA-binding MarR family transcriptional regulator